MLALSCVSVRPVGDTMRQQNSKPDQLFSVFTSAVELCCRAGVNQQQSIFIGKIGLHMAETPLANADLHSEIFGHMLCAVAGNAALL